MFREESLSNQVGASEDVVRSALTAVIVAASVLLAYHNATYYQRELKSYESWKERDARNAYFRDEVNKLGIASCATFASNVGVRGYANFLFNRGIYEYTDVSQMERLRAERGGCASVYLWGSKFSGDLPDYFKVTVSDKSGLRDILPPQPYTP